MRGVAGAPRDRCTFSRRVQRGIRVAGQRWGRRRRMRDTFVEAFGDKRGRCSGSTLDR